MDKPERIGDWFKDKTCYLYMIAAIAVFFFIQPILTPFFITIENKWISECSETFYAIIIIIIALAISVYLILKNYKYKLFISHKDIAFSSLALTIYSYYRFSADPFDFWPFGMWSYTDALFLPYLTMIIIKLCYKKPKPSSKEDDYLLQDRPLEDVTNDIFGFDHIVKGLFDDLRSVDLSKHAFSIGISAPWGFGKSSFLNIFSKKASDENNIVVRFYPRSSRNIEDIPEDFFKTFSIELSKYHTGFKHKMRKYANALQINNGERWLTRIINAFIMLNAIEERDTINEAIKKIGRKIFVIIEDLDRLTAMEILEVLKLIDRNGDFCNTVFLTAYDKKYLNSVLKKNLGHRASQDFTDKYFNYEVSLPVQRVSTLIDYFKEYIKKHLSVNKEDAITKNMIIEAWNKESTIIAQELRSIRHVKRFINIFMSRYPKVKNDINIRDFLLLTLLRYKDINVYNAIANGDVTIQYPGRTVICLRDNYSELVKYIATWDGCDEILKKLFPQKNDFLTDMDSSSKSNDESNKYNDHNLIRCENHFDLYFFDYKVGNARHKDLMKLFGPTEEKEAFSLIDNMTQNKKELQLLEEFLSSRTMNWISNKENLIRLFKLLVYACINCNFCFCFYILLTKATVDEARKLGVVRDVEEYKDAINNAINQMIESCSIQLGYLIRFVIESLLSKRVHENQFIFTHQELTDIAVSCQKGYYSKFGTEDWNYTNAFNLCKIIGPEEGEQYDHAARVELFSLMKKHPDDFAKNIMEQQVFDDDNHKPSLQFIQDFEVKKIFPIDGKYFEDWLTLLSDKTTAEVLKRIYDKTLSNDVIQSPSYP